MTTPKITAKSTKSATAKFTPAMSEYLGRLIYEPKRVYATAVAVALIKGDAIPQSTAKWAEDVQIKTKRHMKGALVDAHRTLRVVA